jgi:hypothetical protein
VKLKVPTSFWGFSIGNSLKFLPQIKEHLKDIAGGDFKGLRQYEANNNLFLIINEKDEVSFLIVNVEDGTETYVPELQLLIPCGSGDIYRTLGKPTVEDIDDSGVVLEYHHNDFVDCVHKKAAFYFNEDDRLFEVIVTAVKKPLFKYLKMIAFGIPILSMIALVLLLIK